VLDDLERRGLRNSRFAHHVPGLNFRGVISLEVLRGITFDYVVHAGQDVVDEIAMAHARREGAQVPFEHRLTGLREDAEQMGGAAPCVSSWAPSTTRTLRGR
jgi:hypothetical protein